MSFVNLFSTNTKYCLSLNLSDGHAHLLITNNGRMHIVSTKNNFNEFSGFVFPYKYLSTVHLKVSYYVHFRGNTLYCIKIMVCGRFTWGNILCKLIRNVYLILINQIKIQRNAISKYLKNIMTKLARKGFFLSLILFSWLR